MANLAVRDLLGAQDWSRLFFTTYALSVSFFEAVVLDAIVRQQVESTLILADEAGVRSAINEFGAQSIGRAYDLEPVVVSGGCFHPKLAAFVSRDDAHLLVGSGNLTFGGWGSNLECADHLHPSFASNTFLDAADFLRKLGTSSRIRHAAADGCFELADQLSQHAIPAHIPNPSIRLLHNLEQSFVKQLADLAADFGGAERLTIVSPFFDQGGVNACCRALRLSYASIHSHPAGFVSGSAGTNWPSGESLTMARPVEVSHIGSDPRRLHCKLFEVVCKRGRLILSGSSNATVPGLDAQRNVELCVLRIHAQPSVHWAMIPSHPPALTTVIEEQIESCDPKFAILRATLYGGVLSGHILNSFPEGPADILSRSALQWSALGNTTVGPDGSFSLELKNSWSLGSSGQVLLRVENSSGMAAQGFAALPEFRELTRRLGRSAHHFFSFLLGRETAADLAEILEYIRTHPEFLPEPPARNSGGDKDSKENDAFVDVATVFGAKTIPSTGGHDSFHSASERRFLEAVLAAFSEHRSPIDTGSGHRNSGRESDQEDESEQESPEQAAGERATATAALDRLLERLIDVPEAKRQTQRAMDITQYVCERLKLERYQVLGYVERLVRAFVPPITVIDDQCVYSGLSLLLASHLLGNSELRARSLRRLILRLGLDFGPAPQLSPTLDGFQKLLSTSVNLQSLWEEAATCSIIQEEMRLFWDISGPLDGDAFPLLSQTEDWEVLSQGRSSRRVFRQRRYSEHCPHCFIKLSSLQASRLRGSGIGKCDAGKLILCEEY